ncbi:hypothetical protein [Thiocapsa roseopersicina]|uniref:Uncharacterized protein n=1 Tax=Thiocapsa roseopersicina TaxID=1058 RepID=A0A1H2WBR0_THIRO|nr:hypothetical protein [Thiocapsa roseopersicina]SDW77724.1 hypothetical protein SAMN05421783_108120 [Thiocapsa roseopersicina]
MFNHKTLFAVALILFGVSSAGLLHAGIIFEGSMTQEQTAQPGERYRGTFVLRNTDASPAEAKLFQTDYTFAADGTNQFGERGKSQRSNANWITLSRELVSIPANGIERIDYEVTVPKGQGAGFSGTYWSLIMVEPIEKTSKESAQERPEGSAQINQITRYGVQVVTHIGKGGAVGLNFTNPQIIKKEGKRLFAIDVENSGQRWLIPSLSLELYSETGSAVGKFQGPATRLYPGTSARFELDLGQVLNGKYLGLVVADGTGDNLFGANVELEIE